MDSSCVVVPTLTTTEVSTSHSLVTTFTESISTGPSSVSPTVISTCVEPPDARSSQCQVTIRTSFVTVPGNTTTVTVPATLTVDIPVTVLSTLFGSSCTSSSISSSDPPTSSTPTPTSTSTSTDTTSTTTSLPIITTPPTTDITTSSLVTSDGSTFFSYYSSTDPAVTADAQSTGGPSDKRIPPGPIIGGVLGGVAALLLLGLLTWYLVKKESKFSHFDEGSHSSHQTEPSYKYGMVGQPNSNPVSLDPSFTIQNALGNGVGTGQGVSSNDVGFSQSTANSQGVMSNDGGLGQASSQGVSSNGGGLGQASGQGVISNDMGSGQATGTSSGQGILSGDSGLGQTTGPPGALGPDGGLGQVSGGHGVVGNLPPISQNLGNPSIIPLAAGIGTAAVASGVYAIATSSRPSSSRPSSSSSQALGPLVTPAKPQGSYPPALQNWNAIHGYGQANAGPSTSSNNNNNNNNVGDGLGRSATLEHGSADSSPSAYSNSSWMGNSSTNYRANDDSGAPGVLPLMGAVVHSPHHQHQQQQQHQYQQHPQNSFRRVASLQVTNNEYHPYPYAETSGAGPSQQAPLYDGQGRPLTMSPGKAPLVHLDGTLYQQPPRGSPRSGTAPPAYIE